jgi:hypothetical protein
MSCPHTNLDSKGRCIFCGEWVHNFNNTPPSFSQPVNPFDIAKGLKEKAEKERREKIPQLLKCPDCLEKSLFYDVIKDTFTCFKPDGRRQLLLPDNDNYFCRFVSFCL